MSSGSGTEQDTQSLTSEQLRERFAAMPSHLLIELVARCAFRALPMFKPNWPTGEPGSHFLEHYFACMATLYALKSNQVPAKAALQRAINFTIDDGSSFSVNFGIELNNSFLHIISNAVQTAFAICTDRRAEADSFALSASYLGGPLAFYDFGIAVTHDLDATAGLLSLSNPIAESLLERPLWAEGTSYAESSMQALSRNWMLDLQHLVDSVRPSNPEQAHLISKAADAYQAILLGHEFEIEGLELFHELYTYFNSQESTSQNQKSTAPSVHSEDEPAQLTPRIYDYNPSLTQSTEQPSGVDHLGRENLYNALAAMLASPSNKGHQTIGLLGEWGAGKSSWIKALENALKSQASTQPFLVSTFNAWSYESVPNLQAGIAHELIKTLVEPPARKEGLWKPTWSLKFWLSFLKRDIKDVGLALRRFKWPEFFDWVSDNPRKLWWNIRLKSYVAIAMHGGWKMFWLLLSFLFAVVPFAAMLYWMPNESADDEHILAVWLAKSAGLFATLLLIYKSCAEQIKTLWAAPRAQELLTYLRLPSYAKHLGEIPEMRKTLEKFCDVRLKQMTENNIGDGHTRLLVVVDDLDRCSHQQIVKVFEAVRLVLEIDQVTVIIAVDQHIALAALALHYKDLAAHHKLANPRAIARDYLAKVIHLPITLSRPESSEVAKLLEYIWETTEPPIVEVPDINPPTSQPPDTSEQEPVELNEVAQSTSENTNAVVEPATETLSQPKQEQMTGSSDDEHKKSARSVAEVVTVIGLSKDQKAAFIHWAKYFDLHNPRQLKRLNNTYSLMLNANKHHDKTQLIVDSDFGRQHQKESFAVLVTLITIEYLNSLDNSGLRKKLKAHLQGNAAAPLPNEPSSKRVHPINSDFIAFFKTLNESAKMNLFTAVESFVLPAIESDEDENSSQQNP